jgi:hypothetical protein
MQFGLLLDMMPAGLLSIQCSIGWMLSSMHPLFVRSFKYYHNLPTLVADECIANAIVIQRQNQQHRVALTSFII